MTNSNKQPTQVLVTGTQTTGTGVLAGIQAAPEKQDLKLTLVAPLRAEIGAVVPAQTIVLNGADLADLLEMLQAIGVLRSHELAPWVGAPNRTYHPMGDAPGMVWH